MVHGCVTFILPLETEGYRRKPNLLSDLSSIATPVDIKMEEIDYKREYEGLKRKYDALMRLAETGSRHSNKVVSVTRDDPMVKPDSHVAIHDYGIEKQEDVKKEKIIVFKATNELPHYLQPSVTELGQIMWRFENTAISRLFGRKIARQIYLFSFGNPWSLGFLLILFVLAECSLTLGLFKIVSRELYLTGFAFHILLLLGFCFPILTDLNLFLTTLFRLSNIALIIFGVLYPLSLAFLMQWDYRAWPEIISNISMAIIAIAEDSMPSRIKRSTALFGNILLAAVYFSILVVMNLAEFPNVNLQVIIYDVPLINNQTISISALGVFNQALIPLITLYIQLVSMYTAQLRRGTLKMRNIAIELLYTDNPKEEDDIKLSFLKPLLMTIGLEVPEE